MCGAVPASAEVIVEDVVKLSYSNGGAIEVLENGDLLALASPPTRVVRIDPEDGEMTVLAGGGDEYPGNGGPATDALLPSPTDIAPLADGGFLVSTTAAVQHVDSEGTINMVAGLGSGHQGHSGDGGPATEATLGAYPGLAATAEGFLITDSHGSGNRIREVDGTGEINTVAGGDAAGFAGDGGAATAATLDAPADVDLTADGGFLIADIANCRVREVDATGEINTVAGSGPPSVHLPGGGFQPCGPVVNNWAVDLGVPGPALEAELNAPLDVAVEPDGGYLFPTRRGNHVLRGTPESMIEVVAGTGLQGWGGDGCPASAVAVDTPSSVAVGDDVTYYVDDTLIEDHKVQSVLRRVVEGEPTDCELIGLEGGSAPDEVDGSEFREKILSAGGADEVDPGGGKDSVLAGPGNDEIDVAGGGKDKVNCGPGRDVVKESGPDQISGTCEVVR